jgi:hypothetical protein
MQWFGGLQHGPVPPAVLEQMRNTILQATDPRVIAEKTAADWFQQVGVWNGKTLEIGRTYEGPAPDSYRYRAIERLPCRAGETEDRCVRLELVSRPPEEQLRRAAEAMGPLLRQLGPDTTHGPLEIDDRVELVVEPDTLDAHWMEEKRIVRMSVTSGAETASIERDEVETTTWKYE